MSERRVVVTGLGATTPLGGTIAETWEGILAGRSGAKPLPQEMLDRYEMPVHFACTIAQDPLEGLVPTIGAVAVDRRKSRVLGVAEQDAGLGHGRQATGQPFVRQGARSGQPSRRARTCSSRSRGSTT